MFDQTTMRARFHELGAKRADIAARAKAPRDRYEALMAQRAAIDQQIRPVLDELKAIEAPLFDIDQERAMISRALGGRTGEPG